MKERMNQLLPVLTAMLLLAIWEAAVGIFHIPLYILPSPLKMIGALISDGRTLLAHARVTMFEACLGMGIAVLLGLVLGIIMDAFPVFKRCVYPILVVTQTVPVIVLAPILIIYLGFGLAPKILTVVLMCFFPIVVSFTDGMADIDAAYVNLMRSFGAGRWKIYALVKLPAAFPAFLSGLKVAATYSISGAVVGEWIAAQSGLGYYMIRVKNGYMLDKVFACVLVIIMLSLLMNGLVRLLQYIAMPYGREKRIGRNTG